MIFPKQFLSYVNTHRELVISGLFSLLGYVYLSLNSRTYADLSLIEMWSVCLPCALLSFYLCWHYSKQSSNQFPIFLMFGFAVLFRLIGITTFPILEDDFYRFLWDGQMTINTGTPYGWIPANFLGDLNINDQFEEILGSINHPEVATIYGPLLQGIFTLAYIIAPGEIWPLQSIFAFADIGIIILLLRFRFIKAHYVLLYAWSPLMIKEFAISAHPDVVGAFFLVTAFYAYCSIHQSANNNKTSQEIKNTWIWIPVCLALATGVKIFALVLAPLLLRFQWRSWLIYFSCLALMALPFAINDSSGQLLTSLKSVWVPDGLQAMANDWLFNAPLYYLAIAFMPLTVTKVLLLGSFAFIAACYFFYVYLKRQHLPIRVDLLYGVFFLCIPVLNPWYIVWLLPFAVIYPSRWAWTASVALFLAYASGINFVDSTLELYQQPLWVVSIEFGLITIALFSSYFYKNKN